LGTTAKQLKVIIAILLVLFSFGAWRLRAQNGCSSVTLCATTGSIGGGALLAGACTSGTVAVVSSMTGSTVNVAPNTYPGDGIIWYGYVSANGTVTVKVCSILALTPTASTYNVRVIQ
jgi:hypothetical protein